MCYSKPGPRCSSHTRLALRAAQSSVTTADAEYGEAKLAVMNTGTEQAKQEFVKAKQKRDEAIKAYKTLEYEYDATPEGVKANEAKATDPSLPVEKRRIAATKAVEGAVRRKEQIEAYRVANRKETQYNMADIIEDFYEDGAGHISAEEVMASAESRVDDASIEKMESDEAKAYVEEVDRKTRALKADMDSAVPEYGKRFKEEFGDDISVGVTSDFTYHDDDKRVLAYAVQTFKGVYKGHKFEAINYGGSNLSIQDDSGKSVGDWTIPRNGKRALRPDEVVGAIAEALREEY